MIDAPAPVDILTVPPLLASLLERLPEPHILFDRGYRILAANAAYRAEFGGDAIVGRTCHAVSHHTDVPCDRAGESCPLAAALASGQREKVLHLHRLPTGPEYVEVELTPLSDADGNVVYFLEKMHPLRAVRDAGRGQRLVGRAPAFRRMLESVARVAPSHASVLLLGESGTGKELVAQAIHEMSPRRARPFVVVECASLPETLFESELFGHEKGAFTGASSAKPGLVESADGGTLFLDEVGDIPLSMQVKLLRLLESGCYRRVGGNDLRHTDVRVISATHRDLRRMVADGGFRQDLFFRLATFPIRIPPLRERLEDIELLAMALLRRMGEGRELALTPGALDRLRRHDYPGNVRELRNILERAMLMADGTRIGEPHMRHAMDDSVWTIGTAFERRADAPQADDADGEVAGTLKALEAEALSAALAAHQGDRRSLAKKLGISERTLYRRLRARGPG